MDEARLAAIRAAEQKATPGPWSDGQPAVMSFGHYVASDGGAITGTCAPVNVHFIAMARTAVPELLDLVDSLQRENQKLRAVSERLKRDHRIAHYDGQSLEAVCSCGTLLGSVYGTTRTYAQLFAAHLQGLAVSDGN